MSIWAQTVTVLIILVILGLVFIWGIYVGIKHADEEHQRGKCQEQNEGG